MARPTETTTAGASSRQRGRSMAPQSVGRGFFGALQPLVLRNVRPYYSDCRSCTRRCLSEFVDSNHFGGFGRLGEVGGIGGLVALILKRNPNASVCSTPETSSKDSRNPDRLVAEGRASPPGRCLLRGRTARWTRDDGTRPCAPATRVRFTRARGGTCWPGAPHQMNRTIDRGAGRIRLWVVKYAPLGLCGRWNGDETGLGA
jgi:hypothetical protein